MTGWEVCVDILIELHLSSRDTMSGIKGNVFWYIWRITGAGLSLISVETKTIMVAHFCSFAFCQIGRQF